MRIEVLTLFPELYPGPLGGSIIGRAVRRGLVTIAAVDLRDYTHDERGTVDDRPYGGGPGMLMKVEPLVEAVEALRTAESKVILLGPRGARFTQALARELSKESHLILVAGHYEGVDERVRELAIDSELSVGDYVLTSGNLAAMTVIDAVTRLLPGVLGSDESSADESFSEAGGLEYPQYTRPEEYRGLRVPTVLLSGDHGKIAAWRRWMTERLTKRWRPDLWPALFAARLRRIKKWKKRGKTH